MKQNLKALKKDELEAFIKDLGWPLYRGRQIHHWIYQRGVADIGSMTNLSRSDREILEERAYIGQLKILQIQTSSDGTRKFLSGLEDGARVETVLIPDEGKTGPRLTLCISTQVGCTLDCSFCLTGRMGLKRNLKPYEISDQLLAANQYLQPSGQRVSNVVLMGMGEPLANFSNVVDAVHRMSDPHEMGFSQRRITISTAGLVPQIRKLGRIGLKVNLAVSLNATTDEVRDRIMGTINRLYPIQELVRACRDYPASTQRPLTFEYVLIRGLNDSTADALRLVKLIKGIRCKVNLIPYNEHPGSEFKRPEEQVLLEFQKCLRQADRHAFIRKSRGRDILAACGQLETHLSSSPSLDTPHAC